MRRVGVSIFPWQITFKDDKFAIAEAKKAGADTVDFCLDFNDIRDENSIYSKGEKAVIEYYTEIKKYADKVGIEIFQTHGRIKGLSGIEEEDNARLENLRLDLLASKALGAYACVVHNAISGEHGADPDKEMMYDLSMKLFSFALPIAKECGVKIAVETFGNTSKYNTCDFFGRIEHFMRAYNDAKAIEGCGDMMSVCIDTGHTHVATHYNNPDVAEFIRKVGSEIEISCMHMHDNDSYSDQHNIPLGGTIDWIDTLGALEDVGYNKVYNLEIDTRKYGRDLITDAATFGVKVMRQLLTRKFGNN